jgi:hypothetical protein
MSHTGSRYGLKRVKRYLALPREILFLSGKPNPHTALWGELSEFPALGPLSLVALLFLMVTQTGCHVFRGFGTRPAPVPVVFNTPPAQTDLLAKLNEHASRVKQLQSNVMIELPGSPRLNGTLLLERPDRLRMKAGVAGMTELGFDIGSNSEVFWLWNKASVPGQPPPAIHYARQSDYHRIQQMAALPLEPQWIIDATGVVEFSPDEVHQGPYTGQDGRMRINTLRRTPDGHVTRVAVIDPKTALIMQQALYDSANRLIGYTNASNFEYFAEQQVSLPRRIEIHLTSQQDEDIKLVINATQFRINSFYGNPDQTWSMPTPDGVPLINLAE